MASISSGPSAHQAIVFAYDVSLQMLSTKSNLYSSTAAISSTNVGGKESIDVNVTSLTLTATDDSIESRKLAMAQIIDEVSASLTYVCEALPGTLSSAASWRIKRISVSGTVTTVSWADGNSSFDNIADNRASLSYS